jgi:hypothetical protein
MTHVTFLDRCQRRVAITSRYSASTHVRSLSVAWL